MKKLLICLALSLAFTVGVSASNSEMTTISVGIQIDPGTLDPFAPSGNGRNNTLPAIYEKLANFQGVGGPIKGVIAKEWEQIDDLVYQIEVYDNIYDTVGNHIDAYDVAWCHNTAKERGNSRNLGYMKRLDAIDDYTLELEMTDNIVGLFEKFMTDVYIVDKDAYSADSDAYATNPIGTNQYKVVEYIPGSELVIEKKDNYWQSDKSLWTIYQNANVDKINFKIIAEESQRVVALETGIIDMASGFSPTNVNRFKNNDDYNIFSELQNLSQVMFFNCHPSNPFNNKELRQAVLYAIDVQGIITGAAEGNAEPCYTFGGNMFRDYNPEWEKEPWYEYDLEKAKELFAQSGYKSGELTVRMVSIGDSVKRKIAQIMQGYLIPLGINVEIINYEDALFNTYKYKPAEWDILIDNCGASDYLVTLWRGKFDARQFEHGGANFVQDEKFHQLIIDAFTKHTTEDMDAFQEYLYENAYASGLFNAELFVVTAADVEDICFDAKQFLSPANCVYSWN